MLAFNKQNFFVSSAVVNLPVWQCEIWPGAGDKIQVFCLIVSIVFYVAFREIGRNKMFLILFNEIMNLPGWI